MYRFAGVHHARSAGGHRHLALRRDAGGGLHQVCEFHYVHHDQRWPALRRRRHAVAGTAACSARAGHRHDAAARAVPDQRLWRQATDARTTRASSAAPTTCSHLLERLAPLHKRKGLFWAWRRIRCARCRPTVGAGRAGPARPRPQAPIHIHIAEQTRRSMTAGLERPAPGAVAAGPRAGRRALVPGACHAHDAARIPACGAHGAVAGICPSTEANLGDGIFDMPRGCSRVGAGAWAPTAMPASMRPRN
jgi:formimidoylglutamate deiminase